MITKISWPGKTYYINKVNFSTISKIFSETLRPAILVYRLPALDPGNVILTYVLNFLADKGQRSLITLEPHQEGSRAPSLQYFKLLPSFSVILNEVKDL